MTIAERISAVTPTTGAGWSIVDDLAFCVWPTCAGTWILAFGVNAGKVRWTVRIPDAFWSAILVRISNVLGQTGTGPNAALFPTDCIGTAGRRIARTQVFFRLVC